MKKLDLILHIMGNYCRQGGDTIWFTFLKDYFGIWVENRGWGRRSLLQPFQWEMTVVWVRWTERMGRPRICNQ